MPSDNTSARAAERYPSSMTEQNLVATQKYQENRLEVLDVLRGIAVIAVMLLHSGGSGVGRSIAWYDDYLWPILRHGYLGVQLFFVISGYCIQGAIESARRHEHPVPVFLQRRVRRIYPPYWWSLLIVIVLAGGTIAVMGKTWASIFPLSRRDWLLNVILLQGPFHAPDAGMVYWTLTIEVQFYALMAIGLWLGRWSTVWLVALSSGYLTWTVFPSFDISGTGLAYWPEFACGIAAYHAVHHRQFGRSLAIGLWGLTALSAVVGMMHSPSVIASDGELRTPFKQCFCLMCGGIVWYLTQQRSIGGNHWLWLYVSRIGVISYSLYLIHVPIGTRVANFTERLFHQLHGPSWLLLFLLSLSAQFVAGVVFFRWCEAPWLNRNSKRREIATSSKSASAPETQQTEAIL